MSASHRPMQPMTGLAALIADAARARMLASLMHGMAMTATELATEAGIAPSTASSHLARLTAARLLACERQGRHRYFRIADAEVAGVIESLTSAAAGRAVFRPGPTDPALREARVCYDHLAGARAVELLDRMRERGMLAGRDGHEVTSRGVERLAQLRIDVDALGSGRRPLCRLCLDWSERRHHLAGALGAALLDRMMAMRWTRRDAGSRAVTFTGHGERALRAWLA